MYYSQIKTKLGWFGLKSGIEGLFGAIDIVEFE